MIDFFFTYINQLSVVFFICCFLVSWFKHSDGAGNPRLEHLLTGALAAATIPTGLALILCAINPAFVSRLEGINVNLSVAGVVLVFMATRTVQNGWRGDPSA
ncbi:MAG: hypothetical protein Q8S05_04000 [Sulfuricella sp.]|nr:hypothetical protein [Sulfuricella sp.]